MILMKVFYLWTNILDITLCLTPATLLALAHVEGQKAKVLATALNWRMKNRYNAALGKLKVPKQILGDRSILRGDRFIRDVREYNNVPEEYYPEKFEGVCQIPQAQDYAHEDKKIYAPHFFQPHLHKIPSIKGLFPYRLHFRSPELGQGPEEFGEDFMVEHPYEGYSGENQILGKENTDFEERVGTFQLLPFTPVDYGAPSAPPYQNPSDFDPLAPENRQPIIDFIESKERSLEMMIDALDRLAFHYNGPNHLPKPEYSKPPENYAYTKNEDKTDKLSIPTQEYSPPETNTPTLVDTYKEDVIPTAYPIDHNIKQVNKYQIKHKIYEDKLNRYLKIQQEKIADLIHSKTIPNKPEIVPIVYPIYPKKPQGTYLQPETGPYTTPDFGIIDPSKQEVLPSILPIYSNVYKMGPQNIQPAPYLPTDNFEIPTATESGIGNLDQGIKHIDNDGNLYDKNLYDSSSHSQMVDDQLEQLRDSTKTIVNSDHVVGGAYQPFEDQNLSEITPDQGDIHKSHMFKPENANEATLRHIIKVPHNYHYYRRSIRDTNVTADDYLNNLLNEGKDMLKFLQKIASHNEDMMMIGYLGNSLIDDVQRRLNLNVTRRKRNVPVETLLMDPKIKVDMPKVLENIGTFFKTLFDHKDTPLYHVRNIVGSAKDMTLATLKIPNQNFIVPTGYNIVDNPNKDQTVLESAYPDLSSRFGNSVDDNPNWPQELVQSTFQNVGQVIRNTVKSGQEAIHHVGEITNHAKKAILTAKQTPDILMQTVSPIPVTSDQKKVNLQSRFSDSGDDQVLEQIEQTPPEFVKMGHLLDAAGISNPARNTPRNIQTLSPRMNEENREYIKKFWENIENVVHKSNAAKNIQEIFPRNNNGNVGSANKMWNDFKNTVAISKTIRNIENSSPQNTMGGGGLKQIFNNIQGTTTKLRNGVGSNGHVKKMLNNLENNVGATNPQIHSQPDMPPLNSKLKDEYVQKILNKLEEVASSNFVKNIQKISPRNSKGKNEYVQKVRNKLEDMVGASKTVKNVQRNNQESDGYLKKIWNNLDSMKKTLGIDDIHDFIVEMKDKLKELRESKPSDIRRASCYNKRVKRRTSGPRFKNEKLTIEESNHNEDLVGASFIPSTLTHPFLIPDDGLMHRGQSFGRTAQENQFILPISDLIGQNEDFLGNIDHHNKLLVPDMSFMGLFGRQNLLGPILGSSNPDMLEQTFHEHFTKKGINAAPKDIFQRNQNVNNDDERVSTSMTMTPTMLTPFMGKIKNKKKQEFYEQYAPTATYNCFFGEEIDRDGYDANSYDYYK